jgi:hypothetical protein
MPTYPLTPLPSKVSAPEIIDPMLLFETDSGYSIRRVKRSRPLRRYTLDYLGKSTLEMRLIQDFFYSQRLGTLEFDFYHPTASEAVQVLNTTPVILVYPHGLITGQWLIPGLTPNTSINGRVWQVTRIDGTHLSLNGSAAGGTGTGQIITYLPHARGVFSDDTWQGPVTLIGPEQVFDAVSGRRSGYFNFTVTIEELF